MVSESLFILKHQIHEEIPTICTYAGSHLTIAASGPLLIDMMQCIILDFAVGALSVRIFKRRGG